MDWANKSKKVIVRCHSRPCKRFPCAYLFLSCSQNMLSFRSNPVLRGKWDAWTNCAGMSIEKSMQEYTNLVDSLEPSARRSPSISAGGASNSTSTKITAAPVQHDAPVSVRKQGTLYKQRDLFKGWRPRHFVLQDNFLHYYLEPDDPVPRNTLDLTGCSITTTKSVTVDGVEYFPFVITHPKSKTPYHLSSDSKLDAVRFCFKPCNLQPFFIIILFVNTRKNIYINIQMISLQH